MNMLFKRQRSAAALALLVLFSAAAITACSENAGTDTNGKPGDVQFVVDTGPGGGSDVFAREVVKIALANKLIDGNWPVLNRSQGGGLAAMSFLKQKSPQPDFIAAFTSKWIISGLNTPNAEATVKDLTLIAQVSVEPQMVAVPANSPYKTMADFIAAAKAKPGQLVQVGGAYSSVDNLAALKIQQNTGTKWKYLSFADGGPRITALLRGDAQMMLGAQNDFSEEVAAGQLRIIGVMGKHRATKFPDVPTFAEQGIPETGLPEALQWRAIAGPANMPPAAVTYYRNLFSKLTQTADWKKYMDDEGLVSEYVTGPDLDKRIDDFTASMAPMVNLLKSNNK
ncbi:tripartite tricarboxylate transporter substrate binding protein [Pinirhizobacter sp.]|jgi:putative tricarboxylic transport membrane protein|uniref:tripartite tricarboxylate transporter substrate binding protein n=1 Tax=Pinirhizobacter sp. TaxID=2950432 RepID=UPI002F3E2F91